MTASINIEHGNSPLRKRTEPQGSVGYERVQGESSIGPVQLNAIKIPPDSISAAENLYVGRLGSRYPGQCCHQRRFTNYETRVCAIGVEQGIYSK